MTDPVAGVVHDGHERPLDMQYSSQSASVYTYWLDFYDPESGIDKYDISIDVNNQVSFKKIEKYAVINQIHVLYVVI
jgi:hypothetical protein